MTLWERYLKYIHPALAPNCWGEMLIKSFESADNIIDVDKLRREQRAGICLTFNFQRLKSCLERVSSSQTAVDILREAEKARAKRLREDVKHVLIPLCTDTLTCLEEVDASLKSAETWFNNVEGDGEEQARKHKRRVKQAIDDIWRGLAIDLRRVREQYATRLATQLEALRQVDTTLAHFDSASDALQNGEEIGDEKSAEVH